MLDACLQLPFTLYERGRVADHVGGAGGTSSCSRRWHEHDAAGPRRRAQKHARNRPSLVMTPW